MHFRCSYTTVIYEQFYRGMASGVEKGRGYVGYRRHLHTSHEYD